MNCEQALQAMSARLDGELPEDEARALDAHLRECAPCRALMAELTELDDGLKTLSVEPPETLAPGVMRAIRAETAKKQKKRTPHITTWLIAGAAALALALGAAGVIELPGFGEKGRAPRVRRRRLQNGAGGREIRRAARRGARLRRAGGLRLQGRPRGAERTRV